MEWFETPHGLARSVILGYEEFTIPLKLQEIKPKLVSVKATGKITDEDHEEFIPWMEGRIEQWGRLRMLFEMEDFHGWDLHSMWHEFRFESRHKKDLKRVAVVGEEKWERWASKISGFFTSTDVRYFDRDQIGEARAWLEEDFHG